MYQPLTDAQWQKIEPLFPPPPARKLNRVRKRADYRKVLNSILWILHTGAGWKDLPKTEGFVAFQSAHRYLQTCSREGILFAALSALASEMKINLSECFIDGTFIPAKGGGEKVGEGRKGFGGTLELIFDARGLPIAVYLEGADVHETRLVEPVIEKRFVKE